MLNFDMSTLKLAVDKTSAVHAAALVPPGNPTVAVLHLTNGANTTTPGAKFNPAYTITGSVDVLLDDANDRNGWSFSFIQFANLMVRSTLYGGRTVSEGSIFDNFAVAPAFPTNPSLDSTKGNEPFMGLLASPETTVSTGPPIRMTIERKTGDHPHSQQALVNGNLTSGVNNFLWNMRLDLGLTTCFVAKDPKGTLQYLAHLTLHCIYDAKFSWQGNKCTGGVVGNPRLDVGPMTQGKPTDKTLQTLLANPKGPLYNDLCDAANKKVLTLQTSTPPIHNESATRDPSIPANFYQ